jgi:hypothetical protein
MGESTDRTGHICISPQYKNAVKSNSVGAAAYWGHDKILELVIKDLNPILHSVKASETSDNLSKKSGAFHEEFKDFTPDFLACASPNSNVHCIRLLAERSKFKF